MADENGGGARRRSVSGTLKEAEEEVGEGGGQERAVDDVEDAAEAGDEGAAVFDLGVALHETFEEVAELADAADDGAEEGALVPGELVAASDVDLRGHGRADG